MSGTRENGWLQKLMYVLIAVLGIYILYKSIFLLLKSESAQQSVESSALPRNAEDAAVRTYAPGYAAAVEGKDSSGWLAGMMEPLAPVYSYLLEYQADENESEVQGAATEYETGAGGKVPQSVENAAGDGGQVSGTTDSEEEHLTERRTTEEQSTEEQSADETETDGVLEAARMGRGMGLSSAMMEQMRDFNYLLSNYYTVDAGTTIDGTMLDVDELLAEDLSIRKNPEVPQILIYHTHSQEYFADSIEGDASTSVVGAGEVLAELLRTKYGYQVIHDTEVYDLVDGVLDRSAAYDYARDAVQKILEENPAIEVVIDLHRDGVEGHKFVTEIDGKPCSMIMFFNGLSRDETGAPLTWLDNPYVEDNLAFSLQLQLKARQQYPGYTRNIYLKAERFNLHLRPRSLLIEAGTQLNTVEEEKNAMEPLAELLAQVLAGK